MNSNESQSDKVTCLSDVKIWWKGKSKLEQKLIIAITVVALVLFGLLLFIIIKHGASSHICTTPACVLAASQILSHIDPAVDPCEDFFQFACGNFIKNSHGDIKASTIVRIEEDVQRQLVEILNEPIMDTENRWIKNEKLMFQACLNETAVEEESLPVFENMLEALGGWPVVTGYQATFDWKFMVYKLRESGYPHSVLMDVGIQQDPTNKTRFIVNVVPANVDKIKDEHKQFYKNYMVDIAVMFGANRYRANNEMEDVLSFRENLSKIYNEAYPKNETTNYTAMVLEGRMKVKRYQELNGEINWLDFINTILHPVGKVNIDDYVSFPRLEYTGPFFVLLNRTNKRIVANYIIWMVIEEVIPYMPKNIKERWANYTCLTGKTAWPKTRSQFCKTEIHKIPWRPMEIMYARKYLPIDERKNVQEILENVKSEFVSTLQAAAWMDAESKKKTMEKAKSVVEIIGAPGDYFGDGIFAEILGDNYTSYQDMSYFQMLLSEQKLQIDLMYFKMHMNVKDTLNEFYRLVTEVNAFYSAENNAIIIPVGILQGVFYDFNRPGYMNYGAIGSIIGHELTHGFGESGSKYESNGRKIQMWTNATLEAYKEKTQCIVKEADDFVLDESQYQNNGTLTLEENLADYTGVKVSYAAYNKWKQRNGEEPLLPQINYTPNQLFWISAVSYECFQINKHHKRKMDLAHAHNSFRVIAPLRSNPYFAADFSCPVGSKMNPAKKCQVY